MSEELMYQLGFSSLPEGWEIEELDKICSGTFDCPHSTPKLNDSGPYLARTQDIREGYFKKENAVRVSEETYQDRVKRAEPSFGDLLLSREGTYFGDAAEVPKDTKICLGQRMVLLRPNQDIIQSSFLRLWINSPLFQRFLLRFRDGTVAERLNLSVIRKLPILVPCLEHQDKVVKAIVPFEQKIHLNQQINQTLEQMAQAMFKSWFVDFEPVKAKIAANQAGRDPERAAMCALSGKTEAELNQLPQAKQKKLAQTVALFPDAMIESELGMIPEGWEVSTLKKCTTKIGSGSTPRGGSKSYIEDGIRLVRSQNVHDSQFKWDGIVCITDEAAEKLKGVTLTDRDVLINITGDSILRSCVVDPSVLPARVNQHVAILRPRKEIPTHYLHQYIVRQDYKSYLMGFDAGGSRQAITKGILERAEILLPSSSLLKKYNEVTFSWFESINQNNRQTYVISQLRDSLLPKLLSGKLEVLCA